jgi:polysaccharide deacetylase 2 family uncharacterized protein YibQ
MPSNPPQQQELELPEKGPPEKTTVPEKGTEGLKFNPSVPFSGTGPFSGAPLSTGLLVAAVLVLGLGLALWPEQAPQEPELTQQEHTDFLQLVMPERLAHAEPTELNVEADTTVTVTPVDLPIATNSQPQIVIILDDIGYSLEAGMRAVNLPGEVTLAVLPYTPHGRQLAEAGHAAGKEIMLHTPMSNLGGMDLGPLALTLDLDEPTMSARLRSAIADIPHIKGINNHTGSELTAAAEPMRWVMQELRKHDLFFVDSMTTHKSVAAQTAIEFGIPTLRRHVFLDNVAELDAVAAQFEQALSIARRDGLAVAIGHPYPATLDFLEQLLPRLQELGVALVPVSEVITGNH